MRNMLKRLSLHLATLVLLAALATATVQTGVQAATVRADDTDRAALVTLYTATDGREMGQQRKLAQQMRP